MPAIHEYHCDTCEFTMPSGWGGYMYVQAKRCAECGEVVNESEDFCVGCGTPTDDVDADGFERVTCPHPGEHMVVRRVLGENPSDEVAEARTGFNAYCVCLDCLSQFELDTERDARCCPDCGGEHVKTEQELVGDPCPNCSEGTFVRGEQRGVA
ncbi:MAG: hypothetical protein ABEJ73_05770 [Haloplanus sp.]